MSQPTTTDMQVRSIKVDNWAKLKDDKKQYYRDDSIYIYSPSDGVLDIVSDVELRLNGSSTYTKVIHIPSLELSRPNTNPPAIVQQDNIMLMAFSVDTDVLYYTWLKPTDYAGGDVNIAFGWTNDGGTDDNGLNVKARLDYQTFALGDPLDGSHASSPQYVEDTYTSDTGWILHKTGDITIGESALTGKNGLSFKISFVTPSGSALTCDPHLAFFHIEYTAYKLGDEW